MLNLPPIPKPGQTVSATLLRDIVMYLRAITPISGAGMKISRTPNGTVFQSTAVSGGAVLQFGSTLPFQIRWYQKSETDDTSGEWQIYLPFGCVSFNSKPSIPLNDDATDENGKKILDWYKIPDPILKNGQSGSSGDYEAISYPVYIRHKPYNRFFVTSNPEEKDFSTVFKVINVGYMQVAEIKTDDGTTTIHTSSQGVSSPQSITYGDTTSTVNSIVYKTSGGDFEKSAKFEPYVVNVSMVAGAELVTNDDVNVSGWKEVWLHLKHSSEDFELDVAQEAGENGDDNTYILIYKLEEDVVTADLRSNANRINYYA